MVFRVDKWRYLLFRQGWVFMSVSPTNSLIPSKCSTTRFLFIILNFTQFLHIFLSWQEGAYVAQYKFTVLLMPNGPHKITGAQSCPTNATHLNILKKYSRERKLDILFWGKKLDFIFSYSITGLPFDEALYKSEHSLEDAEILVRGRLKIAKSIESNLALWNWMTDGLTFQKLLKTSANPKAAKKKKKAAEKVTILEEDVIPINQSYSFSRRCLTRLQGRRQPLPWWSNSWQCRVNRRPIKVIAFIWRLLGVDRRPIKVIGMVASPDSDEWVWWIGDPSRWLVFIRWSLWLQW